MPKRASPKLLFDAAALRDWMIALVQPHGGDGSSTKIRAEALAKLKETRQQVLDEAEKLLFEDGGGTLCAQRLSDSQDELIRIICDFAFYHVYRVTNPSDAERLTVIAVGGYGRGTLAPGSDIDLLFLLPYKQTAWGESVVEYVLYMLWDMGLKVGNATRRLDDCIRLARSDMTIRTSILEARYVWGDDDLYAELVDRFDKDVVRKTASEFVAAKLAERNQRHDRVGQSRYVVEPNVKEGKGGLRDLHTLFWIAKYYYQVRSGDELVKAGVFSRKEFNLFRKCSDFLWAVRCHMHFLTGRAEERLSFDIQRELAERLGYTTHPGMRDVERFMKHYFLVAKDVGDLTRILCAKLEEQDVKQVPSMRRFIQSIGRRRRKSKDTEGFVVETGRINIADDDVFKRDPVNLIRIFAIADRDNLAFHPDALHRIARSGKLFDRKLRTDPEANQLFLDILTSRSGPEIVLRRMNETGVLGRFVPEFGKIVAMMQFNMYHHYTVDEHLLRAIGVLSDVEQGTLADEHPLADEILPGIRDRVVLFVALFMHDIAKGRPEDHSIAGARIAKRLCPRLGLNPAQTELVAWLVEQHLVMSTVAQSRDLHDRRTIADFAANVQTLERMKMLLILTVADIKAVGPGVWNGWKGQLLRTLYYETEPYLTGGFSEVSRDSRINEAKSALRDALTDWSEGDIQHYLQLQYPAYWLRVDPSSQIAHARFLSACDANDRQVATLITPHTFEEITEITVIAPDHPRLLSIVAGACTVAGANIVDAQIYTTTDGRALDSIFISREFDTDGDELRRGERIGEVIENGLIGQGNLTQTLNRAVASGPKKRLKAFSVETTVTVNNDLSDQYSVIEISGLDRPGLLYELTGAISDLNLNIVSAHIATFGEKVVDAFYVTDLTSQKITRKARQTAISKRLREVTIGKAKSAKRPAGRRAPAGV